MAGPNGNGNGRANRNGKGVAATRPACFRITHAQRQQYLNLIADGISSGEAARTVKEGYTGRLFRSLRLNDQAFGDAYAEAIAEAGPEMQAELDDIAMKRIRDPDRCSDRALHNERIYRNPNYRDAHNRQRLEMTGADGGPVEVANVEGAAERLRARLAPVLANGSGGAQA